MTYLLWLKINIICFEIIELAKRLGVAKRLKINIICFEIIK
ncbi:hypothetical protein CLSA_c19940 [Clostridium saccharobutylicum DSM 13864]|uniref:Uncharacterized protein n=1 Tax=Clostridium saccharobutylicum DSM 13864 TaxID=1345695 RepID=U5MR52_CLOSA|nr:hypothetical protein CLSA_c19940 [Clostridium saccharobutylicum DSM 13864]